MAAWKFNWTAAHAVHGERVFFASQDSDGRPLLPVPRVIALAPTVPFEMDGLPGFGPSYLKVWVPADCVLDL